MIKMPAKYRYTKGDFGKIKTAYDENRLQAQHTNTSLLCRYRNSYGANECVCAFGAVISNELAAYGDQYGVTASTLMDRADPETSRMAGTLQQLQWAHDGWAKGASGYKEDFIKILEDAVAHEG